MAQSGRTVALLPAVTFTTAVGLTAGTAHTLTSGATYAAFLAVFTYGSGGTTVDAYVQTSLDGVTWQDVANFNFTTASATKSCALSASIAATAPAAITDGTLASNTINNGLLGTQWRVKYKSTGTYAGGTTLSLVAVLKGPHL